MKVYIRFEDTYGMADFYSILKQVDLPENASSVSQVGGKLWIRRSLGIRGIFNIQRKELQLIESEQIDIVICVVDLDNYEGDKAALLSATSVQKYFKVLNDEIQKVKECKVVFVPVTYAAETLMLYVLYNCILNPIEVVSKENTNKLHYLLVRKKLIQLHNQGLLSTKKIDPKKVRLMLHGFDVVQKLQQELDKARGNEECLRWLLDSDVVAIEICLDYDEFVKYVESAGLNFERCMRVGRESINICSENVQICDLTQLEIEIEAQLQH